MIPHSITSSTRYFKVLSYILHPQDFRKNLGKSYPLLF